MGSCLCSRSKPNHTSIIKNAANRRLSLSSSLPLTELFIVSETSDTSDTNLEISIPTDLSNNADVLTSLAIDILRNIATFLSIPDYVFGLLQVNKRLNYFLSPYKSPNIMEQMIMTKSMRNFDLSPELIKTGFLDYIANADINDRLEEWQIMATLAWQNHNKIEYENIKQIMDVINKNKLKKKSLYSSLYLLHFMYKCRYGNILDTDQLKELLFRLICNGGGLGFGHMIVFYYEETFGAKLRKWDNIPIDDDMIDAIKELYNDGKAHGLLRSVRFTKYHNNLTKCKCKSKYSQWAAKQIFHYVGLLYAHSHSIFDIYGVYSAESYREIYRRHEF